MDSIKPTNMQLQVPPKEQKRLDTIRAMLFTNLVFGDRKNLVVGAALRSIRNDKYWRYEGCKSMEEFIKAYKMPRRWVFNLIKRADEVAIAANLDAQDLLTMPIINLYLKAKFEPVKEKILSDPKLLLTCDMPAPTKEDTDKAINLDKPTIRIETDDPAYKILSDNSQRRLANHNPKETDPKKEKKTERDNHVKATCKQVRLALEFVHLTWHGFDGFTKSEKQELLLHLRWMFYCLNAKPRKSKDPECPPFTYETIREMETSGTLDYELRQDLHYALTGKYYARERNEADDHTA